MGGRSLPDSVAQCYYTHGLFCSSHQITTIGLSIICFLLCCYPLLNIPLPGSIPTKVNLPIVKNINLETNLKNISDLNSNATDVLKKNHKNESKTDNNYNHNLEEVKLSKIMNETINLPHLWAKDEPLLFVQQIILKTGVWPWKEELKLGDAFRAPLQEVFRLLETIRNHQQAENGATLSHVCFQVENVKRNSATHRKHPILPEYNCLILSPANLWQQNVEKFSLDDNILSTIFGQQNLQKGKVSMAEMLFGMHLKDTGIKRYPIRARPRALQYAITLFFNYLDEPFIESLKIKLNKIYSTNRKLEQTPAAKDITLIYYPGEFNYHEFIPLCITFLGVFAYMYYSFRKLDYIKSKLGLAISVVASIAASLIMCVGFCFFFGMTLSFKGKEIFPYLVILVGMENAFVITKSVMSVNYKLDVKIRIAQGLSKEGWSITKNLLIEITILTISLFTFVPIIQQFSIFMIVGLLSDFFLQMCFYTTVLGIDIKRKEMSREKTTNFKLNGLFNTFSIKLLDSDYATYYGVNSADYESAFSPQPKMLRSKSHPKLNTMAGHANIVVGTHTKSTISTKDKKVPKRLKLVYIWARTRFFQRAFMLWMIVWISMIIYSSGIVENILERSISKENRSKEIDINQLHSNESVHPQVMNISTVAQNVSNISSNTEKPVRIASNQNSSISSQEFLNDFESMFSSELLNKTLQIISLRNVVYPQPWLRLSEFHWSSVLSQYNVSIAGKYIALLPPLLLKHRVTPEEAIAVRNPDEKDSLPPPSRWRALAAALDPIDFTDFEFEDGYEIPVLQKWTDPQMTEEQPYYPTSPMELLLLAILCTISVVVIAYTMVVLYRCICTRNYAEWRTSWTSDGSDKKPKRPAFQLVMEAIPIVVEGHQQEVECLVTDGEIIISSCLQGQLKVWNPANAELTANIDRRQFFESQNIIRDGSRKFDEQLGKIYQDASPVTWDFTSEHEHKSVIKRRIVGENNLQNHQDSNDFLNTSIVNSANEKLKQRNQIKKLSQSSEEDFMGNSNDNNCLVPQMSKNMSRKSSDDTSGLNEYNSNPLEEDNMSCSFKVSSESKNDINKSKEGLPIAKDKNDSDYGFMSQSALSIDSSNSETLDSSFKFSDMSNSSLQSVNDENILPPSIWCMDFFDDIITIGCSDGQIEFWEASTGKLKCIFDDGYGGSVNHIKFAGKSSANVIILAAARLSGHLDLLQLEGPPPITSVNKRTHIRTGSAGSIVLRDQKNPFKMDFSLPGSSKMNITKHNSFNYNGNFEQVICSRLCVTRAHQQPITALELNNGRIMTGSDDHTLKVFSSNNLSVMSTLHGHCGPITCIFIDQYSPMISGSGSQDGLLCVWDLMTGTCIYSVQAHDGPVNSLGYTTSYVMSMGSDEKLCIWDRFRGHLLNSVHIGQGLGGCGMLTITDSLVVTGGRGGLTVWDASTGEAIRRVALGNNDGCVFVRQILPLKDAIVCDYSNQLRIVRFPLVTKVDCDSDESKSE